MYKNAQGIEAYVYDDKIEDADAGKQHSFDCVACHQKCCACSLTQQMQPTHKPVEEIVLTQQMYNRTWWQ